MPERRERPEPAASRDSEPRPLKGLAIEVLGGVRAVVRSEVRLAKAELRTSSRGAVRDAAGAAVWGGVAASGIFPFQAFLIFGLAEFLNHNYWLSALVVAVVSIGAGGLLAYGRARKLTSRDFEFTRLRSTFAAQREQFARRFRRTS